MDNDGSSVTLVFYRVGERWWKEPFLNIVAAAAQMSSLTHVEIAIGEEAGVNGMMTNVCRVFNDNVGVELVERTGRNPQYVYLQLGCSKKAVSKMIVYARKCVGKPFSNVGMARSLLWPRKTDNSSFFCAELVAAILKEGGLMDSGSNPGSATPEMIHRIYKDRAAVTANPFVLRDMKDSTSISLSSTIGKSISTRQNSNYATDRESLLSAHDVHIRPSTQQLSDHRRVESPPRGHFRVVKRGDSMYHHVPARPQQRVIHGGSMSTAASGNRSGFHLTLHSLDMNRRIST